MGKLQSKLSVDMKIVSLYGRGGKGKTTTLKLLLDLLKGIGKFTNVFPKRRNDECGVLIVDKNGQEVKVGITTKGDDAYALEYDFSFLGKCDLYICASRIKGGTLAWLKDRTKNGYLLRLSKASVIHEQGIVPSVSTITQKEINTWQAQKLFEIIKSLI